MQGRGWALFKLGHFNEAVNAFRSAAEFASEREDRIESLLKEGDALMAAKRFDEAAALYAKLEQEEPADIHAPRALFQSANALERSGRKEEAIKVYLKISEKYFGKDVAPPLPSPCRCPSGRSEPVRRRNPDLLLCLGPF